MSAEPPGALAHLLAEVAASGVEAILVGGLAAVAQGAPITTFDVDIVHRRTEENVDRLLQVLTRLGARYRRPGVALPPNRAALLGPGHSLFVTDLGALDALGTIEGGRGYDDLLPESVSIAVRGHALRVLSLAAIIDLKQGSTEAKDKLRLPIYRAVLARQR